MDYQGQSTCDVMSKKARSFTIIVIISLKCFSFSADKVCDHIPPSSGSANSANNIKPLSSSVLSFSGKKNIEITFFMVTFYATFNYCLIYGFFCPTFFFVTF